MTSDHHNTLSSLEIEGKCFPPFRPGPGDEGFWRGGHQVWLVSRAPGKLVGVFTSWNVASTQVTNVSGAIHQVHSDYRSAVKSWQGLCAIGELGPDHVCISHPRLIPLGAESQEFTVPLSPRLDRKFKPFLGDAAPRPTSPSKSKSSRAKPSSSTQPLSSSPSSLSSNPPKLWYKLAPRDGGPAQLFHNAELAQEAFELLELEDNAPDRMLSALNISDL